MKWLVSEPSPPAVVAEWAITRWMIFAFVIMSNNHLGHAESSPSDTAVEHHLYQCESASYATRQVSADWLRRAARQNEGEHRAEVRQAIARSALSPCLETQWTAARLLALIDDDEIAETLSDLGTVVPGELRAGCRCDEGDASKRSLIWKNWTQFASVAGDDRDAVSTFTSEWLHRSEHWRLLDTLASTLSSPIRLYDRRRTGVIDWLSRAVANQASAATPQRRVTDRLVEQMIRRNPLGWDVPSRLRLAIVTEHRAAAIDVCRETLNRPHHRPEEVAVALLAVARLDESTWFDYRDRFSVDPRPLTVRPVDWSHRIVGASRLATVPTRVQDIVTLIELQRCELDPRDWGMIGLEADPWWGARLESIWFASEPQRDNAVNWLVASIASPESDEPDRRAD